MLVKRMPQQREERDAEKRLDDDKKAIVANAEERLGKTVLKSCSLLSHLDPNGVVIHNPRRYPRHGPSRKDERDGGKDAEKH